MQNEVWYIVLLFASVVICVSLPLIICFINESCVTSSCVLQVCALTLMDKMSHFDSVAYDYTLPASSLAILRATLHF